MSNSLRCVIVDDEDLAIVALKKLLEKYCPQVEILGSASDTFSALKLINTEKPEVVFLDVEMPHANGFELLENLIFKDFSVIFTTAYSHYAIDAIKEGAHDYLMKPIDSDELIASLGRLKNKTSAADIIEEKLTFKCSDRIYRLTSDEITHCVSESNYTHIHLDNGKEIMISSTLKSLEEKLRARGFIRVHQSHLVNKKHVLEILRGDEPKIILKTSEKIPISYRRRSEVFSELQA